MPLVTSSSFAKKRKQTALFALSIFFSAAVQAEDTPAHLSRSYSYFGLGLDTLVYRETVNDLVGVSVETDFSVTAPVQRSGGYTEVNSDWGFSITTLSTLFSREESEDWNAAGYGTIQSNQMSLSRQEVNVLAHRHLDSGFHLIGGLNYSKISFNRHHFMSADGTDAFRKERLSPGQIFDPEAIEGSISEEQMNLSLLAGIGYDSYFQGSEKRLRLSYDAAIGLPFYRRVINAYEGATLTDSLGSGISATAGFALGWQFSRHISVVYRIEALYTHFEDIQKGALIVPEVDMYGVSNSVSAYWNF